MKKLTSIAKTNKVNLILVESNFGDGMFTELLKPYLMREYPCTTEEVRHNIQKERRIIDTLEPVLCQHRLVIDVGVIKNDYESTKAYASEKALQFSLIWQLSRISRAKGSLHHDDRLDALSMAVGFWVDKMAQDADRKMAIHKDRMMDEELERFMEHAIGRRPQGETWM